MDGKQIYQRFINELISKGVTIKDFCDEVGITPSAMSNWKNRGTMPSANMIITICDYLNVSADYLLGRTDTKTLPDGSLSLAPDEMVLLKDWREYDDNEKRMVLEMLSFINSKKTD